MADILRRKDLQAGIDVDMVESMGLDILMGQYWEQLEYLDKEYYEHICRISQGDHKEDAIKKKAILEEYMDHPSIRKIDYLTLKSLYQMTWRI